VDVVYGSTMCRPKGGIPLLRSGPSTGDRAAKVAYERRMAAKQRRPVAPGGAGGGARRGSLDLELWASVWDATRLYVELGGR
jgi:hypothetical protein